MAIDSVLIIGFGGPTPGPCRREGCRCKDECNGGSEAICFVSGILGDKREREDRVQEIAPHYKETGGGFSPYNELTFQQANALTEALKLAGTPLPVYTAFRHWMPWPKDVLAQMYEDGYRNTAVVIVAPHQSFVSWDWYINTVKEAAEALDGKSPAVETICDCIGNHQGFIQAIATSIRTATNGWDEQRFLDAELIMTAHAIPKMFEKDSPYRPQFAETSELAAKSCGHPEHTLAFQSMPDGVGDTWSTPPVTDKIKEAHAAGKKDVIIHAAGFLVDHTEVTFDLDIEAKELCEELGLNYTRARCVHSDPAFINALVDVVTAVCP